MTHLPVIFLSLSKSLLPKSLLPRSPLSRSSLSRSSLFKGAPPKVSFFGKLRTHLYGDWQWLALPVIGATLLSGCQSAFFSQAEPVVHSSNVSTSKVASTADVEDSPTSLTIVSPPINQPGNTSFIRVSENNLTVTQVKAADIPGSKFLFRLQDGEDMDKFVINEQTGLLSFKDLPDWDAPGDADKNNNYMVLVQVASTSGNVRNQFLVVQVTDLPD